jgi:hypothetical protein
MRLLDNCKSLTRPPRAANESNTALRQLVSSSNRDRVTFAANNSRRAAGGPCSFDDVSELSSRNHEIKQHRNRHASGPADQKKTLIAVGSRCVGDTSGTGPSCPPRIAVAKSSNEKQSRKLDFGLRCDFRCPFVLGFCVLCCVMVHAPDWLCSITALFPRTLYGQGRIPSWQHLRNRRSSLSFL